MVKRERNLAGLARLLCEAMIMFTVKRERNLAGLALLLCGAMGCAETNGDALVVATPWNEGELRVIEVRFHRWIESRSGSSLPIVWVRLAPGEDPARVVERDPSIDIILGGADSGFRKLADAGRLAPIAQPGLPLWYIVRRASIGLSVNRAALASRGIKVPRNALGLGDPALRGLLAINDPRTDPVSLALAEHRLGSDDWAGGYEELVRMAGNARPVGRGAESARTRIERGEAGIAPSMFVPPVEQAPAVSAVTLEQIPGAPEIVEAAAMVRGSRHAEQAQEFLRFLSDAYLAESPVSTSSATEARAKALLADMLGATLIDAQVELRAAWVVLSEQSWSKRTEGEAWLTEAPPWPPASVERLRDSAAPEPLIETLVQQLSSDPAVRAWLLEHWKGPARPIDGALLAELANALDGRVAEEPRFRAWLRAEWTAWARQRYRAVTRPAEAPTP